jgi:hypothetical protein
MLKIEFVFIIIGQFFSTLISIKKQHTNFVTKFFLHQITLPWPKGSLAALLFYLKKARRLGQ